ncbi:putative glycosyl transferase, family 14 [Helianthus annuus]|nr:putative glycosyl transferase, family 14 [Helianthus annuus]
MDSHTHPSPLIPPNNLLLHFPTSSPTPTPNTLPSLTNSTISPSSAVLPPSIPTRPTNPFHVSDPPPKTQIAFLFLTNTPLHFAPLWERFFNPNNSVQIKNLYNVYVHSDPTVKPYVKPQFVYNSLFEINDHQVAELKGLKYKSFIEIIDQDVNLWDRYTARGNNVMTPEVKFENFRHYFPTFLSNVDPDGCAGYTLTRVNWTDSVNGHPHTYYPSELSPELIYNLRRSSFALPYMFARKFSPDC